MRHAIGADHAVQRQIVPHPQRQRREPAIAGPQRAHALRIGDALRRHRFRAVHDIVDHRGAPLAIARIAEIGAIAGRSPEIGLQHGIATARQELRDPVKTRRVPRLRSAMRQDHGRERPGRRVGVQRIGHIGGNRHPVPRLELERLDLRHFLRRQHRPVEPDHLQLSRFRVEQAVGPGETRPLCIDQETLAVPRP